MTKNCQQSCGTRPNKYTSKYVRKESIEKIFKILSVQLFYHLKIERFLCNIMVFKFICMGRGPFCPLPPRTLGLDLGLYTAGEIQTSYLVLSDCTDSRAYARRCPSLAKRGYCTKNPAWMVANCYRSCGFCRGTGNLTIGPPYIPPKYPGRSCDFSKGLPTNHSHTQVGHVISVRASLQTTHIPR